MARIGSEVKTPRRRARAVALGFGAMVFLAVAGLIVLLAVLT